MTLSGLFFNKPNTKNNQYIDVIYKEFLLQGDDSSLNGIFV